MLPPDLNTGGSISNFKTIFVFGFIMIVTSCTSTVRTIGDAETDSLRLVSKVSLQNKSLIQLHSV